MQFSEYFEVAGDDDRDWFDPILDTDTRLFVDPFLIFKERAGPWSTAHGELIGYFDRAFRLLSGHEDRSDSLQYRRVVALMEFREPGEFCLGYVATGTRGSGAGTGLANQITEAMRQAIKRGLDEGMAHFEELGVLVERINKDRISDMTLSILKPRFIEYTQRVAGELGVAVEPLEVANSVYDPIRKRWAAETFDLPRNPFTNKAVLLVPKRFLRELPTLNPEDWFDYSETTLRDDLNLAVMENVNAREIVRLARHRSRLCCGLSRSYRSFLPARSSWHATGDQSSRRPCSRSNRSMTWWSGCCAARGDAWTSAARSWTPACPTAAGSMSRSRTSHGGTGR